MTKAQFISQIAARCVNGTVIAYEFVGTEQYDSNNPNQTDGGGVVNRYNVYGFFPAGKLAGRINTVKLLVQDEGGANEEALVEPDSLDGIFRGEVESYLDTLAPVLDYQIDKVNLTAKAATVKVALADGLTPAGTKIVKAFVEQDNQGVFSYKLISSGDWGGI